MEKARELQKKHIFLLLDCIKTFNHVDHSKLWKILKEMEYQATLLFAENPVCGSRSNS